MMLLGSEIGAALTALEPLGIDMIGLNCATGPWEMSEHLRYLAAHSTISLSCEPNAGLPELTKDGARYPLTPDGLADAHDRFTREFGLSLVGGCCGTTPEQGGAGGPGSRRPVARRKPRPEPGWRRCTRTSRSARTPRSCRSASGPTPPGPRRSATPCWRAGTRTALRSPGRRPGCAHLLDVNVDYVGRDGAADMPPRRGPVRPPPAVCGIARFTPRPPRPAPRPPWRRLPEMRLIRRISGPCRSAKAASGTGLALGCGAYTTTDRTPLPWRRS